MFTDDYAGRYLFHYTKPEVFLDHILPTMTLRMSSFADLNDPRESKNWLCSVTVPPGTRRSWDLGDLSRRFTDQMKGSAYVLFFTRDDPVLSTGRIAHLYGRGYAHPSMWDRYSKGHSGVCLAFDVDTLGDSISTAVANRGKLFYQGVSYEDMPRTDLAAFLLDGQKIEDMGEDAALQEHQERHAGSLYFYKSTDWSIEFEYRWVLIAQDRSSDYYVDIRRSLAGVIFGDAFPSPSISHVLSQLRGTDVNLAHLNYRNGDPVVRPISTANRQ